jgi:hypothetical protein
MAPVAGGGGGGGGGGGDDVVHWVAPSTSDDGAQITADGEIFETELAQYDARKDQSARA